MDRKAFDIPQALIRKYGTRDPFRIAGMLGISVKFISTKRQKGFCRVVLKNPFIFINRNMSEQMQKMTCAHELGHLLMHRDILTERSFLLEYELFDIRNDTEYEANVFAANLLIDEEELREYMRTQADMVSAAAALDINVNLLMIRLIEMRKNGADLQVPFIPDRKFMGKIKDGPMPL